MIGRTVSHYRIVEKIGEGGMGVVYKAEDTVLGRPVALKFLSRDLVGDAAQRERLLREARAVGALEHQNVCTIHEVGETDDGQVFICMACYEGDTLKDVIRRGPVSPSEAVKFGLQIARGLAAAHEAGITHRDVKPGNVMVSSRGHVRVVDFGLAKLTGQSSLTKDGSVVGTVAYMSPEQTRGEKVDGRTDVWALGVILYEMVTGQYPFRGDTEREVVRAIQEDRPPALSAAVPETPPVLDGIVAKALEKRAGRRYASMGEMLEDIQELARQLQLTDDSRTATWRYARRRERSLKAAAAFSAAAVVLLLVVWGVGRMRAEEPVPVGIPLQVTSGEGWEGHPAISPDGTRVAYVSVESGNAEVYVTDVLGGHTLRLTDDPEVDFAPSWFPDGASIAFTSGRNGVRSIWTVAQFGGGATLMIEEAQYPVISPDGSRIAFARLSESQDLRLWVASVDDPSDAVQLTDDDDGLWDHTPTGWSPDGQTIGYWAARDLWTVDPDGGTPQRLTTDGHGDMGPVWSSDGRYVYFSSWREGTLALWRVPAAGGTPVRVTQGVGFESEPTISRDGSRMAYSAGNAGAGAVVMNLTTGQQTVVGHMRTDLHASLSSDGRKMVFTSWRWDRRTELAEQRLDGGLPSGPPRRLTDQKGNASHPTYSPDGRWIAYYLITGESRDIWTVPATGGVPVQVTTHPAQDLHPAWSPDGGSLAFMSDRSGSPDLWVVPVEEGRPAGEPRRLTDGSVAAVSPSWSPDGSEVAFVGSTGEQLEVWIVAADGRSPARRLTEGLGVTRVRWDSETGNILAAGTGDTDRRQLWSVSPNDGAYVPLEPAVVFGTRMAYGLFDLAKEARLVVFSRENLVGDIWVSEGPPGLY